MRVLDAPRRPLTVPATSFSFGKYDPRAVKDKLRKLRVRLNPMVYQLPYYANFSGLVSDAEGCHRRPLAQGHN